MALNTRRAILACFFLMTFVSATASFAQNELPSWNDGTTKKAIISFVQAITDTSSPDYVPPAERIAVFDNDGTLWSERPVYFQLLFAIDRVKELAPQHPEWKTQQPFKAVLENDMETLAKGGQKGVLELVMATHANMTTEEFTQTVQNWLSSAIHPTMHKPYTELVFEPMLELLTYLRAKGFKTFIVSGGGVEFMRAWTEKIYGIPPEQVVGSSFATQFELQDGKPVLIRQPKLSFYDDKEAKPVAINQYIGRQPIFAFGNSDGDLQMLQWTTLHENTKHFAGIVHHTDSEREFAYDKDSHIGQLDKALTEAEDNGWTVVDMKKDWKVIYPSVP